LKRTGRGKGAVNAERGNKEQHEGKQNRKKRRGERE